MIDTSVLQEVGRVRGEDGVFGVKGFSKGFLLAAARPKTEDATSVAPQALE
jgi:hypothetical protein